MHKILYGIRNKHPFSYI